MSVSKTSKLLNYINYSASVSQWSRKPPLIVLICVAHFLFFVSCHMTCHWGGQCHSLFPAGMRVTLIDGRHIVGR